MLEPVVIAILALALLATSAAALRLRQSFPQSQIRAFALVRTLGLIPEVHRVFDPCKGEIRWNGTDAQRDP